MPAPNPADRSLSSFQQDIIALLRREKAILLVHFYQRPEIQQIADFLGDSLALCMEAARTDAKIIVFAGVHFMAESAAILCPDKTVIIPRPDAGCPLADTITSAELAEARRNHPGATVVTYVNSTAEIKALSDLCCTSANALDVINSIPDNQEILMIPDGNLARYTALSTDRQIIPWKGFCPVHQNLKPDEVFRRKREYPGALFVAHPECSPEVLRLADFVGSTSAMLKFVHASAATTFIVGTEIGILTQMEKENPDKTLITAAVHLVCDTMKYTTLEDIYTALKEMKNIVTLNEEKRRKASTSLQRMLAISGMPVTSP